MIPGIRHRALEVYYYYYYLNPALYLITVNMDVSGSVELEMGDGSKVELGVDGTVDAECIDGMLTTCKNHKCACTVLLIVVIAAAIGIGLGVHFGLLSVHASVSGRTTETPIYCGIYGYHYVSNVKICCLSYDFSVICPSGHYGYFTSGSTKYCCLYDD